MSVIIREARPADASAIARVHVDTWRTTYRGIMPDDFLANLSVERRERYWRDVLSAANGAEFAYVAEDDGGLVAGFASGGPERAGDPAYKGELYAVYVLEEHQRKGIGRLLTLAVARRFVQAGIPSMLLWVLADNPSRAFYERLGGQYLYEKPITIGGATLTEVAYGWPDIGSLVEVRPK